MHYFLEINFEVSCMKILERLLDIELRFYERYSIKTNIIRSLAFYIVLAALLLSLEDKNLAFIYVGAYLSWLLVWTKFLILKND
ncbi:hypothetical protein DN062_10175 [Nitrincola tibetensis]|uniref:Uncharacterized protein n=1 Tax=Nitrincola tibetensis TaxID=2219697 RepID=A0A364NMM6_9GAMM|nr:hypothetical protein DN062_10175 [Nitrincola tibetensis]